MRAGIQQRTVGNGRERWEVCEDTAHRFTGGVAHGWVKEPSAQESRFFLRVALLLCRDYKSNTANYIEMSPA